MQVRREQFVYDVTRGAAAPLTITELVPEVDDGRTKAFKERAAADVTGWTVWGSAVILARYLASERGAALVAGADVLELGAGCGLSGLAAAQQRPAKLWLTDFNAATVDNLRANAAANAASCAPLDIRVSAMDWDARDTWPRNDGAAEPRTFSVVIGADLVYRRSYARKLAEVLNDLCAPGGCFVFATPGQREGLPTLRQALERNAGWVCEQELEAPPEWRANPLLHDAADGDDAPHFPELQMRSVAYPLNVFVWRRPLEAAAA